MTLRDRLDAAMAQLRPSQPVEAAPKEIDPPGAIPASLVKSAKFASWIAYFALMYFLWERVLDVSEAKYETMSVTHIGPWADLDLAIFFPLLIGYTFVVVGVPYVAKIAIPILVSLNWKEHLWPKLWAAIITVLVSIVLITGTATVGSDAIIESERDKAVAVEQVGQARASIEASITGAEAELKSMMENKNAYLAQAASVGEEQWVASYVAQARREKDARLPMIERATGAARAADAKRTEIKALRQQLATSATTASVSSEVNTARTGPLNSMLGFLNAFWVLLLAVVMDITCLIMPWIALRLEQARNRQLAAFRGEDFIAKDGRPAWATEAEMIPDFREETPARAKPMVPNSEEVFDAETGERLVKVKGAREHFRKAGKKKGEKVAVPVDPVTLPDHVGVVLDSDSRAARPGAAANQEFPDGFFYRNREEIWPDSPMAAGPLDEAALARVRAILARESTLASARSVVESGDELPPNDVGDPAYGIGDNAAFADDEQVGPVAVVRAGDDDPSDNPASAGPQDESTDFLDSLIGPAQELGHEVYEEPIGPQQDKPLGADGKDGVLVSVAAE